MPFIQNNHMVEQIPATVTHPALSNAVLPRTAEASSPGLNAEAPYRADDFLAEIAAPIKDQIPWRGVVRKRFAQLLNDPGAGRMPGHVEVKIAATIMGNGEEAVEDAEGERWHGEEIHRSDGFPAIL